MLEKFINDQLLWTWLFVLFLNSYWLIGIKEYEVLSYLPKVVLAIPKYGYFNAECSDHSCQLQIVAKTAVRGKTKTVSMAF